MRRAGFLAACALLGAGLHAQEAPRPNRVAWLAVFPEPLPDGRSALALEATSQFLRPDRERSADGRSFARLDGEEWQLTGDLACTVGPVVLAGRLRLTHRSGGMADQAFVSWHRLFGMPQGGREEVPKGRLAYHLERDGVVVGDLAEPGLYLMDLDLACLWPFGDARRGARLGLSLQLPTGRRQDFSGSGGLDGVAGAAAWVSIGAWRLHGQAEQVFVGVSEGNPIRAVLARRRFSRAWAGCGWQGGGRGLLTGLGLDLSLAWSESPYGTGLPRLDRPALQQHWTFTHRAWAGWSVVLSEEAGSYTAPDLTVAVIRRF
jgi:hypothetical protein